MAKDSADLQALFDAISEETLARLDANPIATEDRTVPESKSANELGTDPYKDEVLSEAPDDIYQRVGLLTRQLHNALRELGYEQNVENAVHSLPDTRQRLDYIARLTGDAAEKTLANVEKAQDIQSSLEIQVDALDALWTKLYAHELSVEEFKSVAQNTYDFLKVSGQELLKTQGLLTDIMMAQDFHDLTGQVIQKVVKLAQEIEDSLVKLLVDATPPEKRSTVKEGLEGPVVAVNGRDDVVTSQAQVDDLLESLGF